MLGSLIGVGSLPPQDIEKGNQDKQIRHWKHRL